jgi:type IV pilus assembly protein PilC
MPKYNYVVTDEDGKKKDGIIEAPSRDSALQSLHLKDGSIVLSLVEAEKNEGWFLGRPNMSMQEKMLFVKNLATMIKVGITISESFEIIRDQTKDKSLRRMYDDIIDMINSGQSLSKSLQKYDNNFSEIFINMIATGEQAGNLEQVLEYLDLQLEKDYDVRKKVVSALIYPAIIVTMTIGMGVGIVVFIMPKITKIFSSFKANLPLPTRMLIGFSDTLTQKPWQSAAVFFLTLAFFIVIFKLKAMKPFWGRVIVSMPLFGTIVISANVARFSRTINSLLQASVPITEALTIISNTLDNILYRKALKEICEKVEQGGKVGDSLEKYEKLFPPMCTKMVSLGERTGTLEITTGKVAELYEKEVDTKTKNIATAIEPILLIFMAALVGGIAISIILPIYQLPNLIKK